MKKIVIDEETFEAAIADLSNTWHHGGFVARRELGDPEPANVIDADHLARQRDFSLETFGPGARTEGVLDHIQKEIKEVRKAPDDVSEWADLIILAFDGAWRSGHEPQDVLDAICAKQVKNEGRKWPDWRTADPNKAIEHDRSVDS